MSRSAWRIWRISCPRRWASDLAWAGSLCPCSSRRGRISACFSSRASGVVSQSPVLLECQGVGVRPSRCCLMDINNANTLSLMRHRIRPQNASMGHVFQRLFPRGLFQFTTSALGQNIRLCRKVTTVICALLSLYPSLGTWSPSVSTTKSMSLPAAM